MDCESLSTYKGVTLVQTIAIIGTGISAMGAAYFLKDKYDISFYEKNNYPGGHTNTLTIEEEGEPIYIDSAFMVYNERTYPNLTRLFKELDVKAKDADMSFSVQHKASNLEYCGTGLNGLFAQRKNIFSLSHWKLILEMDRFNKEALEVLDDDRYLSYSLLKYVTEKSYSKNFVNRFLTPISSAVWSTPPDLMLEFPVVTLVRFFKNHGFLGLRGHYQWKTVREGSQRYRDKILGGFKGQVFLNRAAVRVYREDSKGVVVDQQGDKKTYDKVIMASHADDTLKVLDDANPEEKKLLSKFSYQKNRVTLHCDETIMPRMRLAWSSWNYLITEKGPSTIYWMNNLQGVSKQKNYFVSINDNDLVDESKIIWDSSYEHPLFNVEAIKTQKQLPKLNEDGPIYFCGAYFKYGFHEDGLTAGLNVARSITGETIWN